MKALTICQPYAHLIVRGEKRVENRTWPTRYRGPLAIHAGKSRAWLHGPETEAVWRFEKDPLVFGAIVGTAQLVACLAIEEIEQGLYDRDCPWLRDHEHTEGPWCWVLDNVMRLREPMPWHGKQGLWTPPPACFEAPQCPANAPDEARP